MSFKKAFHYFSDLWLHWLLIQNWVRHSTELNLESSWYTCSQIASIFGVHVLIVETSVVFRSVGQPTELFTLMQLYCGATAHASRPGSEGPAFQGRVEWCFLHSWRASAKLFLNQICFVLGVFLHLIVFQASCVVRLITFSDQHLATFPSPGEPILN